MNFISPAFKKWQKKCCEILLRFYLNHQFFLPQLNVIINKLKFWLVSNIIIIIKFKNNMTQLKILSVLLFSKINMYIYIVTKIKKIYVYILANKKWLLWW